MRPGTKCQSGIPGYSWVGSSGCNPYLRLALDLDHGFALAFKEILGIQIERATKLLLQRLLKASVCSMRLVW